MKIYNFRNRCERSSRMAFAVPLLLILAGCSPNPNSASLESTSMKGDSKAASVPTESGNGPVAESRPNVQPAQPAPVVSTKRTAVSAADFGDAALNGQLETIRQAIEAGVDVNATDEQKRTALMLASFNGHTSVVELLLKQGAAVDDRDAIGRTALMFAATGANEATVSLLLQAGAEINAVDSGEGFTALMHAAAEGQLKVVQLLLEQQADPTIRDADGDTAQDFASRNGHTDVVQLLSK